MIDPELQAEIRKTVAAEFDARQASPPTPDQVTIWEKKVRTLKWRAAWYLLGVPMPLVVWVVIVLALNADPKVMPYLILPGIPAIIASGFLSARFYRFENLRSRVARQGP